VIVSLELISIRVVLTPEDLDGVVYNLRESTCCLLI